ncbi:gamma-glutamyltranspeptidase/glutathione hydrolase [Halomonas campaniensis]|uniref:Gamma-glutamyltranspeptidase/glutathione hydrolase n=1 Tax=Halomonas campaniensis TaxID=213554 RepID=A0A7W5PAP7_9GAMM|nr:gamma-glutamyltransferase family protein [Halomonas campaniensis]MBB3331024.1 gamma-glutamyltranspeptidase/glutathione hydrolase [Halomonas campaniensis]
MTVSPAVPFRRRLLVPLTAALMLGLPLAAQAEVAFQYDIPAIAPEVSSGSEEKPGWATERFAVAAANPLATDAGYQVLKAGGSAIDAAIAVQMVLTLVEPQSSGIGGGAFLMHYDGEEVTAFDGRETAPSAVDGELFLDEEGEPLAFMDAAASGLSVGVPGTVRMLEMAHEAHGRLPWAELFGPAITLAEQGFAVSPRLHASLAGEERLRDDPLGGTFYYDEEGQPLAEGHQLKNPALGAILRQIAEQGSSALHTGDIAKDLAFRVQEHHQRPGALSVEDLAGYAARQRDPICTDWKFWRVCGFPPPSSGHLTVMQILGILHALPDVEEPVADGIPSEAWLHGFLEAARLAFADRGRYIADPDFVEAPGGDWSVMLDPDYLALRADLVGEESLGSGGAQAGNPGALATAWGQHPDQPEYGTSHISIIDEEGNAIAMTTTIESAFGSRILADGGTGLPGGYLLNNELTDFSFTPEDEAGNPIANRVEAGKRPRSSMSPTLVFDRDSGDLVASLGSPGGAAIIHYTAKALVAMLDWGLDAQEALDLPHAITLGGPVFLEEGRFPAATLEALAARGHEVSERELVSGLQALQVTEEGFFGGADPRREGVVMGE